EKGLRFEQVLKQLDQITREHYKWQECFSLEQLVVPADERPEPNFFPICFDFEVQPARYEVAGISFSLYRLYACIDRFKLRLSCVQRENSLETELHYDPRFFSNACIQRLAAEYHALLASTSDHPEAVISELNILSETEREQLLVEFNRTAANYPENGCLHQLFEAQAKRAPDHIALVSGTQHLTNTELNARANQLAHFLRGQMIGPEALVALCVERSVDMVVGLLGILKAGAAYVPLDPDYPRERLTF